jgi:O-antigen/teichoic acid export membrane protein
MNAYIKMSAVAIFFGAINGSQIGVLSGFEAFKKIAKSNFFGAIASGIVIIIGAYYYGLIGAVVGYGAGYMINWFIFYVALLQITSEAGIRPLYSTWFKEINIIWQMGVPATLSGLIVSPPLWICNAMLVRHTNGFNEIGILSAANQWRSAIHFLPTLIGGVAIPLISERTGIADYKSAQKIVFRLFQGTLLLALPLLFILSYNSSLIMKLYRPEYSDHGLVLILIITAATIQICQAPAVRYLEGTGRMWSIFIINIFYSSILLVTTLIMLEYGAIGFASANVIAFSFSGLSLVVYSIRVMKRDIAQHIM